MALTLIVTNAGRAALVNAANTGTAPVTIAQVGLTATAVTPVATAVALPGEFKRLATLSGDVVDDDTIHVIVRDESTDVFTVRSLALYLADGTLFGIYGQAAVLIEKSAQAMMLLGIDVRFEDIDATSITFGDANFLNPPATTEQIGVVELATLAEAIAGIDTTRVPAAKIIKDAVTSWLDSRFGVSNAGIWHPGNDGAGSGLDADLLDGQQGSYYANIPQRLGFTPVQQGTGNGQLTATSVKVGWSGTRLKATVDVTDLGNIVFDGHITDVWRASNDGSGSGLDADLLDGKHGNAFALLDGTTVYSGALQVLSNSQALFKTSAGINPTVIHRADGSSYSILLSDPSASINSAWNALRPFQIDMTTGRISSTTGQTLSGGTAVAGTLTLDGAGVWSAGNDGSGSGLDADLLDGQQGSYYTNIIARLGYTPLNKAGDEIAVASEGVTALILSSPTGAIMLRPDGTNGSALRVGGTGAQAGRWRLLGPGDVELLNVSASDFTFRGYTVWHSNNDGSGSGLDADLLDGQQGSYYTAITARLGYTPVQQGTGTGQLSNTVKIGWSSGVRLKATVDTTDLGNFVFDNHITDVWRSSNDGSGSGLDADLLDGFQATAFLRDIGASQSIQGYIKLSNGLIIQWGTAAGTYTANTDIQVNYPIAFPNNVLLVTGSGADSQALVNSVVSVNYTTAPNLTRFLFRCSVAGQNRFNWIAIGN